MAEVKMENIKPNSHKSKEMNKTDKEKITPVVSKSSVVSTKKPLSQKFAETFLKEDVDDVKMWLISDVIVPGIKNTLLDMLSMMFFGGSGGGYNRRSNQNGYTRERVSYNSYYKSDYGSRRGRDERDSYGRPSTDKVDYRNIILQRRDDAEAVINEMHNRIDKYGQVSIADMLEAMEITSKYTDNNWGWTSHNDIGLRRVANGWLIDVAEAELLD